jgi:hypothetical protein
VKDQLKSVFVQEPMTLFHLVATKLNPLSRLFDFSVGLGVGVGDIITQASEATLQHTARK